MEELSTRLVVDGARQRGTTGRSTAQDALASTVVIDSFSHFCDSMQMLRVLPLKKIVESSHVSAAMRWWSAGSGPRRTWQAAYATGAVDRRVWDMQLKLIS